MRQLLRHYADLEGMTGIAPTEKGGTGASDAFQAVQNLGGIHVSQLDVPNGYAITNENNQLPDKYFGGEGSSFGLTTLNGPLQLVPDQVVQYTITNYDSYSEYEVAADVGEVSIEDDVITYVAPTATGDAGFTVNGRQVTIPVVNNQVNAPAITSPTDGAVNRPLSFSATANAFSLASGSDSHLSSDWQVARDSAFTNLVSNYANDTVNKTSIQLTNLPSNTTLYLRVRYRGATLGYSAWSPVISFTTKAVEVPLSMIAQSAIGSQSSLAISAFSADGMMVAFGPMGAAGTATGRTVHVRREITGIWSTVLNVTGDENLKALDMSSNGDLLIARNNNLGRAFLEVHRWNVNQYDPPELFEIWPGTDSVSLVRAVLSADGKRIGLLWSFRAGFTGNIMRVYRKDVGDTEWTMELEYSDNEAVASSRLTLNNDGSELFFDPQDGGAGSFYQRNTSTNIWTRTNITTAQPGGFVSLSMAKNLERYVTLSGAVYRRSGASYVQEQVLTAPSADLPFWAQGFSQTFHNLISPDGVVLAVRARRNPEVAPPAANYHLHLYRRSGTTWTYEGTVADPWPTLSASGSDFGYAVKIAINGERMIAGQYDRLSLYA